MKHPIAKVPPMTNSSPVNGNANAAKTVVVMILLPLLLMACDMNDQTEPKTGPIAVPSIPDANYQDEPAADSVTPADSARSYDPTEEAVATSQINAANGSSVTGELSFVQEASGIRVSGTLTGLTPGQHGFHVHEFADCSAPDASSAGDHFSPYSKPHGSPDDAMGEHHAGDLGNILADDQGRADINVFSPDMTLLDGPQSIVGRSVIVHSQQDDLESQPSGNSGDPVGCGTIQKVGT